MVGRVAQTSPMEWSIGNDHGRDSSEELQVETNARHGREPALKPNLLKRMRSAMVIIEGEMDEVLDKNQEISMEMRRSE